MTNVSSNLIEAAEILAKVVPHKIELMWGSSFGFPGTRPLRSFVDYLREENLSPGYLFSAYPGASVTDIASALRVSETFRRDLGRTQELDDVQLVRRWRQLMADVQRDL